MVRIGFVTMDMRIKEVKMKSAEWWIGEAAHAEEVGDWEMADYCYGMASEAAWLNPTEEMIAEYGVSSTPEEV